MGVEVMESSEGTMSRVESATGEGMSVGWKGWVTFTQENLSEEA